MLTQKRLKELLNYNSRTGIFTWKALNKNSRSIHIGDVAGGLNKQGYIIICIDGKKYKAHRLAWLYVYGVWPANVIDHKNQKVSDNKITNLRDVTRLKNCQNTTKAKSSSTTGLLGVCVVKTKTGYRYQARININKVQFYLGTFDTPELAHKAYMKVKKKHHKF